MACRFSVTMITIAIMFLLGVHGAQDQRPPCFSAIYSFGDSLADTGNLLLSNNTIPAASSPYGETYFHKPTGRFSDGRIVVDFIAEASGLPMLEPYLDPTATFKGGVNFAVAGATALNQSVFAALNLPTGPPFSFEVQLQLFLEYKQKFCSTYKGDCEEHFSRALFLVGEIGGNDFNYQFAAGVPIEEVAQFRVPVINVIETVVRRLIDEGGARTIFMQNNLPFGCAPAYLSANLLTKAFVPNGLGCISEFNAFSRSGNAMLKDRMEAVKKCYPTVRFVMADFYRAALKLVAFPEAYGVARTDATKACCGDANTPYNYNPTNNCGTVNATSCVDPTKRFSWDGIHLTEFAYKNIAESFVNGEFTSPPFRSICPTAPAKFV